MRNILVLAVTGALLAAQFHWGLRRKKLLGAVLPAVFALLFAGICLWERSVELLAVGIPCVLALAAAWAAGRVRARRYEKEQLDRMRARELP